jgi:hypothetical protein
VDTELDWSPEPSDPDDSVLHVRTLPGVLEKIAMLRDYFRDKTRSDEVSVASLLIEDWMLCPLSVPMVRLLMKESPSYIPLMLDERSFQSKFYKPTVIDFLNDLDVLIDNLEQIQRRSSSVKKLATPLNESSVIYE